MRTGYDFFAGRPGATLGLGATYDNWDRHSAQFNPAPGCDPNDPASHLDPSCITSAVTGLTNYYATTANVDDAMAWLGSVPAGQPWLLLLSFNAAHSPYNVAPDGLHSYPTPLGCLPPQYFNPTDAICYRAIVEAMDREIARLLASLSPEERARTTVIFLGDNGSLPASGSPLQA